MARATNRKLKILAVASAGGHWVQLLRLRPAFEGGEIRFLTTRAPSVKELDGDHFRLIPDGSMDDKIGLIKSAVGILCQVIVFRPDVVISTGAAPGYMALLFGKLIGARTIWVDSIANSEELSLAGKKVRRWADCWLTQWPELAKEEGPYYYGAVI